VSEWLLKACSVCGVVGGSWCAPVTLQPSTRRAPLAHGARVYLLSWGHRLCVALGQTGFSLTASVPLRHTHPHARHDFVYFSNRQWQRSYFTTVFGNNYFTFTSFQAELLKQFMSLRPQTLTSSFRRENMSNLSYMTIQFPETRALHELFKR